MPRTARAAVGGMCYHVLNRGNGRDEVFHKEEDYAAFVRLLSLAAERVPMRAYLMSLSKLRGEDVSPEIRLSDEQEDKISQIQAEFMAATRQFAAAAREGQRRRGRDGRAPDAMQEPMNDRPQGRPAPEARRPDPARVEELRRRREVRDADIALGA